MQYAPDEASVLRSGRVGRIPASQIVPGDIVAVSVGDKIPADCRLLSVSSSSFRVDQAILTGESESVSKSVDVVSDVKAVKQDMTNMLFSVRSLSLQPVNCTLSKYTLRLGHNGREWERARDRCLYGSKHGHRRHSQVHFFSD
jgi:hypothetical protein